MKMCFSNDINIEVVLQMSFFLLFLFPGCSSREELVDENLLLSYRIENVTLPEQMVPEISAINFTPAGRLVVANRVGEVWIRDLDDKSWQRFAYGLHEPLGLRVESEEAMHISHKPEVTYLKDTNGDGIADTYKTVVDDWGISDNWHEHNFGLPRDTEGNLVLSLGQADNAGPLREIYPRIPLDRNRVLNESKISAAPWQGWVIKVTPSGNLIPWANGFRMAAGVGVNPNGDVFVTDQQGDWVPSSSLIHVKEGKFYGHPASLKWDKRYADTTITTKLLEKIRTPEAVIFPHGSMGGSPGEPIWDTTDGAFGPFANQVFVGDFTRLLMRVDLEKVDGEYQGAVFPFIRDATGAENVMAYSGGNNLTIPAGSEGRQYFEDVPPRPGIRLRQGNMKMAFAPDGSLYVGQTTRGWANGDEGVQRIVWSGRTPVEIKTMRLTERGFILNFTKSMDSKTVGQPDNYRLNRFRYLYSSGYGSPRVDQADVPIEEIHQSTNGESVELVVGELLPGFIYRLEVDKVVDADGRRVENPLAYYTLNRTLDGNQFKGRLSERKFEEPKDLRDDILDIANGRNIYSTYCISCHRSDGRGGDDFGFASPDFTAPNSPLQIKSDKDLISYIAGEKENTLKNRTMPSFGNVLSEQDIEDVLHYIDAKLISTNKIK